MLGIPINNNYTIKKVSYQPKPQIKSHSITLCCNCLQLPKIIVGVGDSYILLISLYLACKTEKEDRKMSETKSLCAKINVELHSTVRAKQEESGLNLNQYIEKILTEYYERGIITMNEKTKTLAIQIPEEMSLRIKEHIAKTPKLTLKGFLIGLIEQALDTAEQADESITEIDTDEPVSDEPTINPQADETDTDDTTADEPITSDTTADEQETE